MRKEYSLATVALCTTFAALSIHAADAPPPLQAIVTASSVQVRNVSSGGEIVLFTAQLEATGGLLRQRTGATRVSDTDRDGIVTFKSPRTIPQRSIWVAIDLETGRSVIAGPSGYPINVLPVPTTLLKKDAEGVIGVIDDERRSAEMLVVRPKDGAWRVIAFEGSDNDGDQEENGKLSLASSNAVAVGNSGKPPNRLKKGDVIAVIDPGRMEVFVTEIGK
jgi:hypothetical protein